MSKTDTLFGAALGAAIVGATLVVREVLEDSEKRAAVRERVSRGARRVGEKAGEVCGIARRKASEVGTAVRERAEKNEAVRRVRAAADKLLRRKSADAVSETDEEETHPVADGKEPEVAADPLATEEDAEIPAT